MLKSKDKSVTACLNYNLINSERNNKAQHCQQLLRLQVLKPFFFAKKAMYGSSKIKLYIKRFNRKRGNL